MQQTGRITAEFRGRVYDVTNPITGFGEQFLQGEIQGFGPVEGGGLGGFGPYTDSRYDALREAMRRKDLEAIYAAAQELPDVRIHFESGSSATRCFHFSVSRLGCILFYAPEVR